MMDNQIIKVVAIGPESTGKSVICQQLAEHYNTIWVKEYAREYLIKNGKDYNYDDLFAIAQGQIANEDKAIEWCKENNKNILFIDTDMYVMKVWYEYVFKQVHSFVEEQLQKRKYDFYLLMKPNLPWEKDELREYPDLETREKLYGIYKNILENQTVPFAIIGDEGSRRTLSAKNHINNFLMKR